MPIPAVRQFASLLILLAASVNAAAQDNLGYDPAISRATIEIIRDRLAGPQLTSDQLTRMRSEVSTVLGAAETCEAEATKSVIRRQARFDPLDQAIDGDADPTAFSQYLEIKKQLDDAISRQNQCGTIADEARLLVARIAAMQESLTQQFLYSRSESILEGARQLPGRLTTVPENARNIVQLRLREDISPVLFFTVLLAGGALAWLIGIGIRARFYGKFGHAVAPESEPLLRYLFPKPLADHAPLIISGLTMAFIIQLLGNHATEELLIVRLAFGVTLYGLLRVIIDWATGPRSAAITIKGLIPDHVKPLRRRLNIFAATIVASYLVFGLQWLALHTESPQVPGRAAVIFLLALALIQLILYLGQIPGLQGRFRLIRYLGMLALFVGIVALLLGYHNFADFIIDGVTRTTIALLMLWILLWWVVSLFEYLSNKDTETAIAIRHWLGISDKATRTGLSLIQLVLDLVIWISFIIYLLYIWDFSGTTVESLGETLISGFSVGDIKLVPINIFRGILVFVSLLIIIGWIKRWVDRRWLQQLQMEHGAREALITIIGYIGFLIAVLVSLTQAKVPLTGLAWISTALALGIGFGMQEIANNFVSGLILLFERPIRTGDFVTVGDTEGTVRSIRIRATEIETLDNQNVVVPNSEFISGRVTNWVLRDTAGRLRVQVGVAYGSNIEKVREILESVAREHSEVITDGSAAAPRALFMAFGESSLDFELRARVYRIDRRFSIRSDINFAIDAEFRKAGVRIPFPQRDLHIISQPEQVATDSVAAAANRRAKGQELEARATAPADGITRSHTERVELAATRGEVWNAITDIDRLKSWLVTEGEFDARIGGSFDVQSRDDRRIYGRIDVFVPKVRLRLVTSQREGATPLPTGPITIEYRMATVDELTLLSVGVAGIPADEDWEQDYNRSEARWQASLDRLKKLLEDEN